MKKAFTLAEVLITLGIIGVVALMTIPSLINEHKVKTTVTQLKAAYSILLQALTATVAEQGEFSGWGLVRNSSASSQTIADYIKPHLKIIKDCGLQDPDYKCFPTRYKLKNGNNATNYATSSTYYKLIVSNGMIFWWHYNGSMIEFKVDVNGQKGPNIVGKDVFEFFYDGTLKPAGAKNFLIENHCTPEGSGGWGCAYYVLKYEKMDYPDGY